MKEPSIAKSMKDFELDKKMHDNVALRAKRRERERLKKLAKRKKLKDILIFSFYGIMLIWATAVAGWMFMQTLN